MDQVSAKGSKLASSFGHCKFYAKMWLMCLWRSSHCDCRLYFIAHTHVAQTRTHNTTPMHNWSSSSLSRFSNHNLLCFSLCIVWPSSIVRKICEQQKLRRYFFFLFGTVMEASNMGETVCIWSHIKTATMTTPRDKISKHEIDWEFTVKRETWWKIRHNKIP